GPSFYKQTRLGRGGQPFTILKFRTMHVDAEKEGQARWSHQQDDRITRIGKFLRISRLDETPQLWNILKGDMSLVGPRPERPEFAAQLEAQIPFYHTRVLMKPGLTGWAQIHYEYGNSTEDALIKLQYDFYYLRHWSFWLDIYTLFRTVAVVVKLKGM
ncbi:MAG: sugar transferase, partial [Chloroflexota bacterium]